MLYINTYKNNLPIFQLRQSKLKEGTHVVRRHVAPTPSVRTETRPLHASAFLSTLAIHMWRAGRSVLSTQIVRPARRASATSVATRVRVCAASMRSARRATILQRAHATVDM